MTITGTNLTTASAVTVGGTPGIVVSTTSSTQIKVHLPAKAAGSYTVVVTTPFGGTSTATHAFTYTRTAPTISAVTPSKGPAAGGQHVKITGTNFKTVATTGVKFGATPATSYTVTSTTQITAVTAGWVTAACAVTVKTAGGTSTNTHTFTYVAAPAITSLTPAKGRQQPPTPSRSPGPTSQQSHR